MDTPKPDIELAAVEISLDDTVQGIKLGPENVDLPTLRLFLQEVESLVKGDVDGKPLAGSTVEISSGSVKLKITAAAWLVSSFLGDMDKLAAGQDLDVIDPKRATVIQNWQKRAEKNPQRSYKIGTEKGSDKILKVASDSDFHHKKDYAWTQVEKFIQGKVTDIGGKQSPNIHLSLFGTEKELTIKASETQLSEERENRLYKEAMLRVSAEENMLTGELRNVRLSEFVNFSAVDEAALQRGRENGIKAWKDVPSASAWVEELRGN